MKDESVNTQSKNQALSNKELQFAIDNTVASLRMPPIGRGLDQESQALLIDHLRDLLLCQRVRADMRMTIKFDPKSIMESK